MSAGAIKTAIVWTAAVIAFLTGIGLCIAGFYVPPQGTIDGTVLTALGELLSFFSGIFGIAEYSRIKIKQIDEETGKKKATDESED